MLGCSIYRVIAFPVRGLSPALCRVSYRRHLVRRSLILIVPCPIAGDPGKPIAEIPEMMNVPAFSRRHLICCLAALSFALLGLARATAAAETRIELISPFPGTVAIAKSPTIMFRSSRPLHAEGRLVLLDGNDVTGMVTEDDAGYRLTAPGTLPAGDHQLIIFAYDLDGHPVEQEFIFTSRHSESFEEIASDNRLSTTVKTVLQRTTDTGDIPDTADPAASFPYSSFDSYLTSASTIKEGDWHSSFRTNIRYYDQNAPLNAPEKKGFGLIDFLMTSDYTADQYQARVEIGDTTIAESKNTIDSLTRRGGQTRISIGNLTVSGFGVLGRENTYEIDGLGLAFNSNDHIMGTSAGMDFFDRRLIVKAVHIRGGDDGSYLGSWSESQQRRGEATGLVIVTDFFEQALMTDFEIDTSSLTVDDDESVEFTDTAYRFLVSGYRDTSDYQFGYSYTGPQYEVIGNQSIVKDWAGFDFNGGTALTDHTVRMLLNYSWDNVEDDAIYARIYSFTGGLDYRYSAWQRFPVGLTFEHNQQRSTDEPDEVEPTSLDTDTLTGSIGFIDGPWAIELRSGYSLQNDSSPADRDTRLVSFSVVPSYTSVFYSILPSWSLNSSEDLTSSVRTDTNTLTLDIYATLFEDRVICEFGGTHDWTSADDDSVDMSNTALYGRLNYRIERLWHLEDPTIAVEYAYNRQEDNIYDSRFSEGVLSLVLSSAVPFSF